MDVEELPLHEDTYFFGYGIDINKPYNMANQIIKLKQEKEELIEYLKEEIDKYEQSICNMKEILSKIEEVEKCQIKKQN